MMVIAGAGVLGIFTSRADDEVQVELLRDGFGTFLGADLEDERKIVAHGDGLLGDDFVTVLFEGEFGWVRSVAHADGDDLSGGGDDFAGFI